MSKTVQRQKEKARAQAKLDERKRVTLRVLEGCEAVSAHKLAELAATGVVPTCAAGCSHCCRLEVPLSRAEAEVLVDWLVANREPAQLDAIRDRLRAWLVWYRNDYRALIASGVSRSDAFAKHAPLCALLEGDRCGAYEARPITCRNHVVSSPVSECDPATSTRGPDVIFAVSVAARTHVLELQNLASRQGGDYLATVHLIAEWLAHLLDVEREPWQGSPRLELG